MLDRMPVKPTVMVYYYPHETCASKLRELQAGLEEEGIPAVIHSQSEPDSQRLGYQAAGASHLGVGIGVGKDGSICIHHTRLPEERPLFILEGPGERAEWRRFGYNAARLVKGTPFKDKEEQPFQNNGDDMNLDVLKATIAEIVKRVLVEQSSQPVRPADEGVNVWSRMPWG
ncbi:glycerol dehydratase reactivase beta/small subunit family protein [Heliobacterium chlorum]|uniref:Glycerol dehydratase reactivase beta/small subunit family protein n=1 Tax=Heliobacterium chlorum TaxID=2698 RepID=A0ABR7T1L3_HELCL|nr:glycerol dehydratase reactivase beta/small subunit family protein [Heliobacterium chlorum]MBC9783850.1 glycerol dehydratase reactivase beta/small subunit family protein [Heliobacterium chlorum]